MVDLASRPRFERDPCDRRGPARIGQVEDAQRAFGRFDGVGAAVGDRDVGAELREQAPHRDGVGGYGDVEHADRAVEAGQVGHRGTDRYRPHLAGHPGERHRVARPGGVDDGERVELRDERVPPGQRDIVHAEANQGRPPPLDRPRRVGKVQDDNLERRGGHDGDRRTDVHGHDVAGHQQGRPDGPEVARRQPFECQELVVHARIDITFTRDHHPRLAAEPGGGDEPRARGRVRGRRRPEEGQRQGSRHQAGEDVQAPPPGQGDVPCWGPHGVGTFGRLGGAFPERHPMFTFAHRVR